MTRLRMGLRCLALLAVLVASRAARADEPGDEPVAPGPLPAVACTPLFATDDPRLFDFVETRKSVDFAVYQGKTIRKISYVTLPVFNDADPHENHLVYRFVNKIHIPTRESPIRRQVLFHEGEPLDNDIIRQSERILRANVYLYDAMILPEQACDDGIDLIVVVRDIWTLQPTFSFKRSGGENSSSIGISDENILGLGHSVDVSYTRNSQRTGTVVAYGNDHLLDGHTALHLRHSDNSDGKTDEFWLERPFYAMDTERSGGIFTFTDTRRDTVAPGGIVSNIYDHKTILNEVHAGALAATRDDVVYRWRVGVTQDENLYSGQDPAYASVAIPADRVINWPWLEFQSLENDFVTLSNYSQLFRNEDVLLGTQWRVRAGAASRALGSTERAYISQVVYGHTLSVANTHLLQSRVSAKLFWNLATTDVENTSLTYGARYDKLIDERNRWTVTLQLAAGKNLADASLLSVGGNAGLRGYPNYWQYGDRQATLNIERRHYFTAQPLHLFRLGAAAFVDTGKAWDSADRYIQSDHTLSDIGIGLRVNPSKAQSSHVIHMNLAFPLTDRAAAGDFQWSVYAEEKF